MAVLLDLSNELIILIASHISKPMHILQLALANRRIHSIAIQHLYGNLTIDRDDYSSFYSLFLMSHSSDHSSSYPNSSILRYNYDTPHSNLLRLSSMMRSGALPAGQTVTRLTIILGINHECNRFQTMISLLLPQLSSLRKLTLKSVSEERLAWHREHFSLAPLSTALSASSGTLQSLDMHFSLEPEDSDGWTIGSLHHFSKLKCLSIQGSVLFGHYASLRLDLPSSPRSLDVVLLALNGSIPSLSPILPPGLKRLRLHWCMVEGLHCLIVLLVNFVRESMRASRKMEELVVQLNAVAKSSIEQDIVNNFEAAVRLINLEARERGLNPKIALEWREEYRWTGRQGPRIFVGELRKLMAKLPD